MAEKQEKEEQKDKKIESYGQVLLGEDEHNGKIQLMTIIGEIEGHDVLPAASKTTKYEHILPQLASIEDSAKIGGVLFLINTVGGDVSAGLALAEMIASMKTPSVSLVLIAGHSRVEKEKLEQMMINTGMLTKDLGTILVGKEAVRQGLIDEVGGISAALEKLRSLMAD